MVWVLHRASYSVLIVEIRWNKYETVDTKAERIVMKKEEKGSLTVEAVLFLIPFMCAFLTLVNVARFVQAEMLVHHAITQTAKELSAYSYILTKTGISGKMQATHRKSEKFITDTTNTANSLGEFMGAVGSVGTGGNLAGEVSNLVSTGISAGENLTNYFSDPKALLEGALAVVQSGGQKRVLCWVVGGISRGNIEAGISKITHDSDRFLKNIGIVDGIVGLDFSGSSWISNGEGKPNIEIVVTYQMKNLLFPEFDFGQHEFCQCASTLIW